MRPSASIVLQLGDRRDDVFDGHARGRKDIRIDDHLELLAGPTQQFDAGDAIDREQLGPEIEVRALPEAGGRFEIGHQRERDHGNTRSGSMRRTTKRVAGGGPAAIWLIADSASRSSLVMSSPQREVERDLGAAAAGLRAEVAHTGYRRARPLRRDRDAREHLIGGAVAGIDRHHDPREARPAGKSATGMCVAAKSPATRGPQRRRRTPWHAGSGAARAASADRSPLGRAVPSSRS